MLSAQAVATQGSAWAAEQLQSVLHFIKGQRFTQWPKSDMHPNSLGLKHPLQSTVNAFPTLLRHAVSIPAFGPWRSQSVQPLLILVNSSVSGATR